MSRRSRFCALGLGFLLLGSTALAAFAFSNGENASIVIGQPNFTSRAPAQTQSGLYFPEGVAFDSSGNLWVADTGNSRVIEFPKGSGFGDGEAAAIVIGQPNFSSNATAASRSGLIAPTDVAFDRSGDLWVADQGGNRVLEFAPPFTNGENASIVIGQPNFTASGNSTTQSGLYIPSGLTFDSAGDLWVADQGNNRVLEFAPPFTDGEKASLVIGQSNFTKTSKFEIGTDDLVLPGAVAFESGDLWVTDQFNNLVLEYAAPFTDGEQPSLAIGGFARTTGPDSLDFPVGLAFDSSGDLWVGDSIDGRVVGFAPPFAANESASLVVGKPDFTSGGPLSATPTTQSGLRFPHGVAVDSSGNLWVADSSNNRVVEFPASSGASTTSTTSSANTSGPIRSFSNGQDANIVIGQSNFYADAPATTRGGLHNPSAVAFDPSGNLWVVDSFNSRILEFPKGSGFGDGEAASVVIGQPNFSSNASATTRSGLDLPFGIAFDRSGDLWVADSSNNRVMEFAPPFKEGENASIVVGQPNFTSNGSATTQSGFAGPDGLAFDSAGNLWVADGGNHRVLEFALPFTDGEKASLVIGQSNFTSSLSGSGTTSGVGFPGGLAFDASGNLWVGNLTGSTVFEFNRPLTNGERASLALGERNIASPGPNTLLGPTGLAFDTSGDLWVADTLDGRVLGFAPPFTADEPASVVVGKSDFTSGGVLYRTPTGPNTLSQPFGIGFDSSGNLWVADTYFNRVVEFPNLGSTSTSSSTSSSTPGVSLTYDMKVNIAYKQVQPDAGIVNGSMQFNLPITLNQTGPTQSVLRIKFTPTQGWLFGLGEGNGTWTGTACQTAPVSGNYSAIVTSQALLPNATVGFSYAFVSGSWSGCAAASNYSTVLDLTESCFSGVPASTNGACSSFPVSGGTNAVKMGPTATSGTSPYESISGSAKLTLVNSTGTATPSASTSVSRSSATDSPTTSTSSSTSVSSSSTPATTPAPEFPQGALAVVTLVSIAAVLVVSNWAKARPAR